MKSQRRHSLESNDLAKRISAVGDRVRPYSTLITVTTVVLAAGVLIAVFVSNRMAASRRAAWDQFTYVMTGASTDWDALRVAAEDNPNTRMSDLALVTWADAELQQAASMYFRDRATAESHMQNAREAYEKLIAEADDPAILNRARLGMARALESEGKPEEAAKFYRAVEGPFAEFAAQRAGELTDRGAQESITWLANAELPEVEEPTGPGTPGARPPFGSDFSLDPSIPARIPTGGMTGDAQASGPFTPQDPQTSQPPTATGEQPLDFENPFAIPSDPDRYSLPPSGDVETPGEQTPAEPSAGLPDAADPTTDGSPASPSPDAGGENESADAEAPAGAGAP